MWAQYLLSVLTATHWNSPYRASSTIISQQYSVSKVEITHPYVETYFINKLIFRYGDRKPSSVIGRILASFWMLVGIVIVSLFTATLTSGFGAEGSEDIEIRGQRVRNLCCYSYDFMCTKLHYSTPVWKVGLCTQACKCQCIRALIPSCLSSISYRSLGVVRSHTL